MKKNAIFAEQHQYVPAMLSKSRLIRRLRGIPEYGCFRRHVSAALKAHLIAAEQGIPADIALSRGSCSDISASHETYDQKKQ